MMIGKLDGINPLATLPNTKATSNVKSTGDNFDTISVSPEAKALSDAFYLSQVAKETPDVRSALIEEVRQKIQDPGYLNDAIFKSVAGKIADSYGI
jgi:negative regulator of flagellin synthesis FlgM